MPHHVEIAVTRGSLPVIDKERVHQTSMRSSGDNSHYGIIEGMRQHGFDVKDHCPKVHCKVFEDNSGALKIATVHKMRPRIKHINVKLHHFHDYVDRGEITKHAINTEHQPADMLTKPLNEKLLPRHHKTIMGW